MGAVAAVDSDAEQHDAEVRAHSAALLLQLVRPGVHQPWAGEPVDWDWLIDRAQVHKVAALLAVALEGDNALARVGDAARARLQDARAAATNIAAAGEHTLRTVGARFDAEGLPYFVVKGCVLAATVYARSDVRTFSDVDIIVPREHVERAVEILHGLDYKLGQVRQTLGEWPDAPADVTAARRVTRRFYERFDHELPFIIPSRSGLLPVDLHWRLASHRRLRVESADLWKETRPVAIGGVNVPTLSPEATLLHLAVHASSCTFAGFRLMHLCDVAWTLQRATHSPDRLGELAQHWGVSPVLAIVFALTRALFGLPVSADGPALPPVDAGTVARMAQADFLIGTETSSGARWLKEARWGLAMGCLSDNVKRSMAVRWTRAAWQLQRAWPRRNRSDGEI